MSTSTKNMSQSMIENIQNYADQIITLEDFVAGVRQNIGMYIGRKGNYGMINMFREILQNGLDEINKNKYISGAELSELLSKSAPTVQRHLSSLTKKGYIRRTGSRKAGYWEILRK